MNKKESKKTEELKEIGENDIFIDIKLNDILLFNQNYFD